MVGEGANISMLPQFEMRCKGQGYSVTVNAPLDAAIDAKLERILVPLFHQNYKKIYGHLPPDVTLEIVNIRARVQDSRKKTNIKPNLDAVNDFDSSPVRGYRPAYFEVSGGFVETSIYSRYLLAIGKKYSGPAIVEERETSIVVGPDSDFYVDSHGNVIVEINYIE